MTAKYTKARIVDASIRRLIQHSIPRTVCHRAHFQSSTLKLQVRSNGNAENGCCDLCGESSNYRFFYRPTFTTAPPWSEPRKRKEKSSTLVFTERRAKRQKKNEYFSLSFVSLRIAKETARVLYVSRSGRHAWPDKMHYKNNSDLRSHVWATSVWTNTDRVRRVPMSHVHTPQRAIRAYNEISFRAAESRWSLYLPVWSWNDEKSNNHNGHHRVNKRKRRC